MWGIVPAAGLGTRIQPLAFSKELLPVVGCPDHSGDRPKAVSEYLLQRMVEAGARNICFVIAPGKADILNYFGGSAYGARIFYAVQQHPHGLCNAIFQAIEMIPPDEQVCIGLPDTIWFPEDGLKMLPDDALSFLLFPVEHPEHFDAVLTDPSDRVRKICVKEKGVETNWIWGAVKMNGRILRQLHQLWCTPGRNDEYLGTLVNAYLAQGNIAYGLKVGQAYVDVGTLHGYREALRLLDAHSPASAETTGLRRN
jgi:glucose-1-phosphate thymidylyltransferase